jgi:hypothetical protein
MFMVRFWWQSKLPINMLYAFYYVEKGKFPAETPELSVGVITNSYQFRG